MFCATVLVEEWRLFSGNFVSRIEIDVVCSCPKLDMFLFRKTHDVISWNVGRVNHHSKSERYQIMSDVSII